MGHLFQHGHRRQIQRVAHAGLKGADAPLAEHHVGVAFRHDVLGAHDQLLQRAGKPALEQHRHIGAAHRLEQLKVLHVAGANLNHVHLFLKEQRDMLVVHQFGDEGLPGDGLGLVHQVETLGTQTLKAVGGGARLERAAAQQGSPRRLDPLGHLHDLAFALHAARAGHHGKMPAADFDAAHIHHSVIRMELAVGFFVRLADAAAGVHHRVGQHPAFGNGLGVTDET